MSMGLSLGRRETLPAAVHRKSAGETQERLGSATGVGAWAGLMVLSPPRLSWVSPSLDSEPHGSHACCVFP